MQRKKPNPRKWKQFENHFYFWNKFKQISSYYKLLFIYRNDIKYKEGDDAIDDLSEIPALV